MRSSNLASVIEETDETLQGSWSLCRELSSGPPECDARECLIHSGSSADRVWLSG
jgi:hypothetical protein